MRLAGLLLLAALSACTKSQDRPFPEGVETSAAIADGTWRIDTLDGAKAPRENAYVTLSEQTIVGGLDGCNRWSFADTPDGRVVVATKMACPGLAAAEAYRELTLSDPARIALRIDGGVLVIDTPGHRFTASLAPK